MQHHKLEKRTGVNRVNYINQPTQSGFQTLIKLKLMTYTLLPG